MDGVHDLGGMRGFGPVAPETSEPLFHADWERRVLALTLATGALGRWTIDRSRFTRESLPPATYLSASYYEIWLRALERLLVQSRLLAPDDLTSRARRDLGGIGPTVAVSEPVVAVGWAMLRTGLDAGSPYERDDATAPALAVGDRVRTASWHPAGHTRLPRYARGKVGVVVAVHGAHVFADDNAVPAGTSPGGRAEWLYTVEFAGAALWGDDADPSSVVSIDAWQPYLAPAEPGRPPAPHPEHR